jgi:ABC-2 type transport system permease protein
MELKYETGFAGMLGVSVLVIAFAWCISWIFALAGVVGRSAAGVQGISMMILFPLTFLSNAYVPIETLPSVLKWFARVNPVSHLITAIREMINQGVIGQDFWVSIRFATNRSYLERRISAITLQSLP